MRKQGEQIMITKEAVKAGAKVIIKRTIASSFPEIADNFSGTVPAKRLIAFAKKHPLEVLAKADQWYFLRVQELVKQISTAYERASEDLTREAEETLERVRKQFSLVCRLFKVKPDFSEGLYPVFWYKGKHFLTMRDVLSEMIYERTSN